MTVLTKRIDEIKVALNAGELHTFSNEIPKHLQNVKGLYTVWNRDMLKYVGVSKNLGERLQKHRSGSRSGDKFNIYVFDRIILRTLTQDQINSIASGQLKADILIKKYVQDNYSYRYIVLNETHVTKADLCSIETKIKNEGLAENSKPYFQCKNAI